MFTVGLLMPNTMLYFVDNDKLYSQMFIHDNIQEIIENWQRYI